MWTLACPFIDKPFAHKIWLENLKRLDFPRKEFKLVFLDFSENTETGKLYQNYISEHGSEYLSATYINSIKKKNPSYVLDGSGKEITGRFYEKRRSVAETMRIMSEHVEGNLLLWEDDIVVPVDAWEKLKAVFDWSEEIAAVTGVQYSRQFRMPGKLLAWEMVKQKVFGPNDSCQEGNLSSENIMVEKERGVESVGATATGFTLYRESFLNVHKFENEGIFGQDILAGVHANQLGKYWMLHWGVKMPHLGIDEKGNFKIYRSPMCKTEVVDESGKLL